MLQSALKTGKEWKNTSKYVVISDGLVAYIHKHIKDLGLYPTLKKRKAVIIWEQARLKSSKVRKRNHFYPLLLLLVSDIKRKIELDFSSTQLNSAQLSSTQLNSARLNSTQLDSA